jgi:NAD(P)H-dependent FMN reductase
MARIALIVGSVRENRQGIKVARWMEGRLKSRDHTVYFIDPLELDLPLLNKMYKEMTNPTSQLIDLRNKINDAEAYMPVTPEYNHNTSAAMKNTLDYFLEEYYFKPSAIVSYSPGSFGGINAAQQLRLVLAELGTPAIPSSFAISRVNEVFDDSGKLVDERYNGRVVRFLDEFEWYIEALRNQRKNGTPY